MGSVSILWANLFSKRNKRTVYSALRQVVLFEDLNKSQLRKIEKRGHIRKFKDKEILFYKGDPSYGIYIVLRGQVDVTIHKKVFQSYKPFDFFGEFALVKGTVRTATTNSVGESTLLYLSEPDLKELFSEDPKMGFSVYEKMLMILSRIYVEYDNQCLER